MDGVTILDKLFKSKIEYKKSTLGSKIKIPLKWYSDLIHIPDTTNEFLLIEWFEDKRCKHKTLWCLGKYMKVSQFLINGINLDDVSNRELTIAIMNDELNLIKLGHYVEENEYHNPVIYEAAKLSNWFGEPIGWYNWYDGEEGLNWRYD